MRDYSRFDGYYNELITDIYGQPSDEGHLRDMKSIITRWVLPLGISSVLDVGCGEGTASIFFKEADISYTGIAIGEDVEKAVSAGRNVFEQDFNFINSDATYDLIFSRHSLEHSPFPLITLMDWHRISNKWLCVVLPNPDYYKYIGRNHYSVLNQHRAAWLLRRAGWKMNKFFMNKEEIWFLCVKKPRISYEGWTKTPLDERVYEFERDKLSVQDIEVDVSSFLGE